MQDINLLQNKVKDRTLSFERSNRILLGIFSLLVVLELAGTVGLIFLTNQAKSETAQVNQTNQSIQANMNASEKDLATAKGLQAQLKNVRSLLAGHIYWSSFFDSLSKITPKQVQYTTISGSASDRELDITGVAPSYSELGRLILSLSTSGKFVSVKLGSVSPSQGIQFGYNFNIKVEVNTESFTKK